jgi:hypothetical protein
MFSPFIIGPVERPKFVKKKLTNGYTSAPHSLLKVSPSRLPFAEVGAVQRVAVRIPPPTISTSCSLKARAPRRSNTLFWLFIAFISFRGFGPIDGPGLQKSFRLRWAQPKNI